MRTTRHKLLAALVLCLCIAAGARRAAAQDRDGYFTTSDGVRLHYLAAGVSHTTGPTLVFIPGWTMPAWIWQQQLAFFARQYRVVALDPRGQGESEIAPSGYQQDRRGQDIAELLDRLGPSPVVLVGWSLGVLDSLAYVHEHGDARLAALVLIDNSVGEEPAPAPPPTPVRHRGHVRPVDREVWMRSFVQGMFHRPPDEAYLDRLTNAALRTPPADAAALLAYPVPRSFWKDTLYSVSKPVLYVVRPGLAGQAANVALHDPMAETSVFADAGHALFVDDAVRFDVLLQSFISRRVIGLEAKN
jgi:non-heme chloroperoxidase